VPFPGRVVSDHPSVEVSWRTCGCLDGPHTCGSDSDFTPRMFANSSNGNVSVDILEKVPRCGGPKTYGGKHGCRDRMYRGGLRCHGIGFGIGIIGSGSTKTKGEINQSFRIYACTDIAREEDLVFSIPLISDYATLTWQRRPYIVLTKTLYIGLKHTPA
jgi:hypothetical protein